MANFAYSPLFPTTEYTTEYELISSDYVRLVEMDGETIYSQAQEELDKLEEQIQLSFETPIDYMVG